LSSKGTKIDSWKLAIGEMVACQPLEGVRYGSAGLITKLFAMGVDGGKAKTE
jgi:hypothetical protein